ncbi:unnamed protein product [Cuscuta campestris]|uniref:Uncharacterized protein n=1 Tax=Cuscuta campestris TaxID=132261 RepID=A0A484KS90_9ASTE|nr:unnamed protein product [Cuscuta campestris]
MKAYGTTSELVPRLFGDACQIPRGHSCRRPRGGVCMAEWGHFGVKLSSLTMVDNFLYLRLGPWLAYGDYGKNNLTLAFVGCNR